MVIGSRSEDQGARKQAYHSTVFTETLNPWFMFFLCVNLDNCLFPHFLGGNAYLKSNRYVVWGWKEFNPETEDLKLSQTLYSIVRLQALTAELQSTSFWAANPQPKGQDYLLWSRWTSQRKSINILQWKSDGSSFILN